MGLRNVATGEYAKIARVDTNLKYIEVYRFRDQNQRLEWGANGLGKYERFETNAYEIDLALDSPVIPEKTLRENIQTKAYIALKTSPEYLDWEDC